MDHAKTPTTWRRLGAGAVESRLLPLAAAGLCLLLSFALRQALAEHERTDVERAVEWAAGRAQQEIAARLEDRILTLVRMADRAGSGDVSPAAWQRDAALHLRHYPGITSFLWLEPDLRVRCSVPAGSTPAARSLPELGVSGRKGLALAQTRRGPVVTRIGEGPQLLVVVPVLRGGRPAGYQAGILRLDEMLRSELSGAAVGGCCVAILNHNEELCRCGDNSPLRPALAVERPLRIRRLQPSGWGGEPAHLEGHWWLRVWPAAGLLRALQSPLSDLAFAAGMLVSALMGLTVRLGQTARIRRREAEQARSTIEVEVRERRQAQEALEALNRELEDRVLQRTHDLRRMSRVLRALGECNQALLRADEERVLLQDVCRVIVEVGGYRLAWVGFAEQDEAKSVRPVAQVGDESGYLENARVSWADGERGRGPTGTAIRTGSVCAVRYIATDPSYLPWREDASQRGFASSIALPLMAHGRAFGALSIYSAAPDAFDEEETRLLSELAGNLQYGITALRARRTQANFFMLVSHKLRTPLSVLYGYLSMLRHLMGEAPADGLASVLDVCDAELVRLSEIVQKLLEFKTIAAHDPAAEAERCSVADTIGNAVAAVRQRYPQRTLAPEVEIAPGAAWVDVSSAHLLLVLDKVLDNAAKFADKESVRVRIEAVKEGEQWVRFRICDDGPGIPAHSRDRVFAAFEQAEELVTGQVPGLGVGLYMARQVVQAYGGTIGLQPAARGTTISFSLPAAKEPAE